MDLIYHISDLSNGTLYNQRTKILYTLYTNRWLDTSHYSAGFAMTCLMILIYLHYEQSQMIYFGINRVTEDVLFHF